MTKSSRRQERFGTFSGARAGTDSSVGVGTVSDVGLGPNSVTDAGVGRAVEVGDGPAGAAEAFFAGKSKRRRVNTKGHKMFNNLVGS